MERRFTVDRRQQTVSSIIRGTWYQRRVSNRRREDDQTYLVDVYDMGLIMVSLAVVLMSCVDAFFTLNLLTLGAVELNVFMDVLLSSDERTFLYVKLAATSVGVVFLTAMSRYRVFGVVPVRRLLEGLCAIYACLIIWELYLLVGVAAALQA
ncbi:MAG: DUF5658 family protein [Gammaproteobacteria bacterium]|jgi:hypothetical protein|nr:DUF5658 family protein [Gammaproteobacteria bacterium]